MSILLDALKKSESQRQLGKTPGIHSTVEGPGQQGDTEKQWIALSMLLLSSVAIGWFGWHQFREPAATPDVAGVDVVAAPQVKGKEKGQALVKEKSGAEKQRRAKKAQADAGKPTLPRSMWNVNLGLSGPTVLPPKSPGDDVQIKEKLSRSFSSYEAEKNAASTSETTAAQSPSIHPPTSDPATSQATPEKPAESELARVARVANDAELANDADNAEAAPSPRRSRALQTHKSEPISFWQIPQALRDDLPDFRINVLVYAEKPQDRFLLINGQRLVEKEELINGVILDEIRRDGAVFRYRNYRFLVKG